MAVVRRRTTKVVVIKACRGVSQSSAAMERCFGEGRRRAGRILAKKLATIALAGGQSGPQASRHCLRSLKGL